MLFENGISTIFDKLFFLTILCLIFILIDTIYLSVWWFIKKYNINSYYDLLKNNYPLLMNNINEENQVKVNQNYFNMFNKKLRFWKVETIVYSIFTLASYLCWIIGYILLFTDSKDNKHTNTDTATFFTDYFYVYFSPIIMLANYSFMLKIYRYFKIKKVLKKWKEQNNKLSDEILIENAPDEENQELFKIFEKKSFKFEQSMVNFPFMFIFKLLKSCKNYEEFCDEFYFFVISNFNNFSVNGVRFKKENFSWLWKNRANIYKNFF
ncbi:MAG0920 family protein [Mycoplasmopsis primatum]|uniref:MAG0920 family protein n=1 Tax=Mycoplasmopsis primatum TaxID=55604 RepID=UPI000497CB66|nr:hypothetical protein [Mycoplasmopsis primatum]